MFDVILLIIVAGITWLVAAEGAWGAAAAFLSVLFAALLAMDYFEPVADLLQSMLGTDWSLRVDFIALVGLFAAIAFGLRFLSEYLVPRFIAVHSYTYDAFRWTFAVLTGYLTMAFLLTAIHTAPLSRDFLGFRPERDNFFGMAPDRQWLGFVQYVSEKSLPSSEEGRIFDGTHLRLPNHDNEVWPTFLIRYATRRQNMGSSGDSSSTMEGESLGPTSAPGSASGPRGL